MNDKKLKPGDIFTNEKGKKYQIVTVATHTDTKEKLVIYQALYGNFDVRALPIERFIGKNTKKEHSDIESKLPTDNNTENKNIQKDNIASNVKKNDEECPDGINKALFAFLEADTAHERLNIIRDKDNYDMIDDKCIDDMAACIDVTIGEGDISTRISELISCLETMKRFEIVR